MSKCKHCGKQSDEYGKGIFCSKRCQIIFGFNNKKDIAREKIKKTNTLKRVMVEKKCKKCSKVFYVERRISKKGEEISKKKECNFCSKQCANSRVILNKTKIIICDLCKKEFSAHYLGKSRFCSDCKKPRIIESKKPLRKGFKNEGFKNDNSIRIKVFKCVICEKLFIRKKNRNIKCCSEKCVNHYLSFLIKQRVENGLHKGWNSRNILSYPEKFFIKVFENNGFKRNKNFFVNYAICKNKLGLKDISCYFLDFYFLDKKIDIEIDGKQHEYEDRKNSDIKRDELLTKNNIFVHRIKWKNPVNETNKEYIREKIKEVLVLINSR